MSRRFIIWLFSYIITTSFIVITVHHLIVAYNAYDHNIEQITSSQSLDTYFENYWQKNSVSKENIPYLIPVGIYIDTLKWVDADSFLITGYIWQKFSEQAHKLAKPGFALPDAVELEIQESYRFSLGSEEVIGWHFRGQISQNFDFSRFPLDEETVKIRIWHGDFNRKVLLAPDFSSYEGTNIGQVFGLSPEIKLGGYDVLDTYFTYQRFYYNTNLGIPTFSRKTLPELTFHIELKRDVSDILVMHFFPIIIVIILCFLTLLSNTIDEAKRERLNFHYLDVITAGAALFFVVILAHSYLREAMSWSGFVYFEYLYVIAYGCIAYITVNSFFMSHEELGNYRFYKIFTYEDNLIPKALFLPLTTATIMMLALVFY